MLRKINILIIILYCSFQASAQNSGQNSKKISLLFIGDIMGHDEQIWSAEDRETHIYNYDDVFKYIRDEISGADYAIANFEVTLAGSPYSGYPQFSSPAALAAACSDAGIDCFVTANNHAADRGKKGIINTIIRLDSIGVHHTGTFADLNQRDSLYPEIIKKNGFTLALLNYTYGTNGIKVSPPAIVNMIDKDLISGDIEKARNEDPDMIIMFLHWGTEYDTVPSKSQTDFAEYLFARGVDLIIGSHPHVLQKMIWNRQNAYMKDRIVVYSLGNFVSNQQRPKTDGGAMVKIELENKGDSVIVSDAGYYFTWVYTPISNYRKKFFVLPCSKFENNPGFFAKPADFQKMNAFIKNSRKLLNSQNVNMHEFIFTGNNWIHK